MYSENIKSFAVAIITVLGLLLTAPVANAFAGHVDALTLRIVEPAVITAAQSLLLDPAPFERGAAMRAMGFEGAAPPLSCRGTRRPPRTTAFLFAAGRPS